MSPNDSDENEVTLPNDTLTILNEFLYEQQKSENVPEDWQVLHLQIYTYSLIYC